MFRKFLAASLITVAVIAASPSFAKVTMVKEVEVNADLKAIQNAKAAAHWATLADDLKSAIVTRLTDRIADDGVKVMIDIDSVELASSLQSATGAANSHLKGHVNILSDNGAMKAQSYDLTIGFEQAGPFFLPGTDLTKVSMDSNEYYQAMIAAFADSVVRDLN